MMVRNLRVLLVGASIAVVGAANAQIFINGNFETGSYSSWTTTNTANGTTAIQNVVQYDIDGAGTRGTNFASELRVGQVNFNFGVPEGIELTQSLNLSSAFQYYFDFDWAVQESAGFGNQEGGIFSLIVNGAAISTQSAGIMSANTTVYGHVTGIFTPSTSGVYTVGARIERPWTPAGGLNQYVDNFAVTAAAVPEPATMAVLAIGGAFLARRRRQA